MALKNKCILPTYRFDMETAQLLIMVCNTVLGTGFDGRDLRIRLGSINVITD